MPWPKPSCTRLALAAQRLDLYRSQFRLRTFERRAHEIYFEGLIKGTSHLATGDLLTTNICFGDSDGSGEYRDAYITVSGTGKLLHMR